MSVSLSMLRSLLERGADQPVYTGWCMWPSAQVAETLARSAFETVLVDMQHGSIGYDTAQDMITGILFAGAAPIVRIPVGEFQTASRLLDAGAQCIVAPMINTAEEAKAFVAATKYTPVGARSYGPFRAGQLYGMDGNAYVAAGNQDCLSLVMIETRTALDNLDAILAVDGIDGVYVGPADLSLTILEGSRTDLEDAASNDAYRLIAARAREAGKFAGIYAPNSDYAKRFAGYGYQLISVSADIQMFNAGVKLATDALGI